MVSRQRHTSVKWRSTVGGAHTVMSQGHYFLTTKTLSKRLWKRYCWRNTLCLSSWSSLWTGGRSHRRLRLQQKQGDLSLGSLLCQEFRRRREETASKWRKIKTSLLVVMWMLRVMTYDIFYKLCWNWIGVVLFVSHEVWFDKKFVIWHFLNCSFEKLCRCDHWEVEFGSFLTPMNQ